MFGAPEPLGGEGQMETCLHALEEKVTRLADVFPLVLPALSLGFVLPRTAGLGRPVGAFEVQP